MKWYWSMLHKWFYKRGKERWYYTFCIVVLYPFAVIGSWHVFQWVFDNYIDRWEPNGR